MELLGFYMTRQELWIYTKKTSFWLAYAVLMGVFGFLFFYVLQEQYYVLTNYSYWREHFIAFPPSEVPKPPVLKEYLDVTFSLFLISVPCAYNCYLFLKRKNKKNGMFAFLAALIMLFIYGVFKCKYISYCG